MSVSVRELRALHGRVVTVVLKGSDTHPAAWEMTGTVVAVARRYLGDAGLGTPQWDLVLWDRVRDQVHTVAVGRVQTAIPIEPAVDPDPLRRLTR